MLIEQSAYTNRWRQVSPTAKGIFSLCGLVAAFAAASPAAAGCVAAVLGAVTVLGAGVPVRSYLRVATPALLFLLVSALSLAVSLRLGSSVGDVSLSLAWTELPRIARVCGRSLGGLAALLFLTLTTPLIDLIALLRRLKVPEILLDIMVLCYRTLFVFSKVIHETVTAQAARLGYATLRLSMRSLGSLLANLSVQVWQHAYALHQAAMARNGDGPLRFLERFYPHSCRDLSLAIVAGSALIALAMVMS